MKNEETIQQLEDYILEQIKTSQFIIKRHYLETNIIGKLLIEARGGGSSGGNCWNNNPSIPYTVEPDQLKSEIIDELYGALNNLFNIFEYNKDNVKHVFNDLSETIYDNPYTYNNEAEYYGNYTQRNLYLIDMEPLLKEILEQDNFEMFKTALENVRNVQEPIYLQKILSDKQKALTKLLSRFEEKSAKDKKHLQKELNNNQKSYDEFDKRTAKAKAALEKELKDIEKQLNPKKSKSPKI